MTIWIVKKVTLKSPDDGAVIDGFNEDTTGTYL